ncbi:MAG: isochorismatase family protein [Chloroflexi bacterium]|nr:isochorismatase family protein [Chloroflexota bacterium]
MRSWQEIVPEADRAVHQKAGFGKRRPLGDRPALLVIDVKRSFVGSRPKPVLEAVEEYRNSCGEAGWVALEAIKKLLAACRGAGLPVVFTTGDAITRQWCGGSTKGGIGKATLDLEAEEIPEAIAPQSGEMVLRKTKASAFFGSPLEHCLRASGIDSLIVVGTSTSGCVRATVVDAFSYGYRVVVVEEGTFDRFQLSHLVSLFDMNAKYADVVTLEEALQSINGLKVATRAL